MNVGTTNARPGPDRPTHDGPADGKAGLDGWLLAKVSPPAGARLLDVGCGFGASLQRWVTATGGSGIGVAASPFQIAKATAAATAAGLGSRCQFVVQDFEHALPGPADVVLAIEALMHAADLGGALRRIAAALTTHGTFVWVDDWRSGVAADDPDVFELAQRWSSPPLRERGDLPALLAAAGLQIKAEFDLTAQVPFAAAATASGASAGRRGRWWQRVLRWSPSATGRGVAAAFLGGLALERLYARGRACYRACLIQRSGVGGARCEA